METKVLSPTGGGVGDTVGPASSTDNAVARFDGTTGKLLQDSSATLSDTGEFSGLRYVDPTGHSTIPSFKGPNTAQGLILPAAGNAIVRGVNGGAYLEVSASLVAAAAGKLTQYDQSLTATMLSTGWHRFATVTQIGNTAATLTDLFNKTLPGGTFAANGQSYELEAVGTIAGTAATDKRVKLTFAGTTIFDQASMGITAAASWYLRARVVRRSTTAAVCIVEFRTSDAGFPTNTTTTIAAETMTTDKVLNLQGSGTNASDVTLEWASIKFDFESWN